MRSERKTLYRARDLRQRMTDAELILWSRIRPRAFPRFRFRRQHPIGPYIADFACPLARMVIEVGGATHSSETERDHDARRDAYIRMQGWNVIRVANNDIYKYLSETLGMIGRLAPPVPPHARRSASPVNGED